MPPPDPRRGRRGATRSESLPERATPRKPETAPLWDALHDHGAELVLVGHAHNYERFEPMDSTGAADADSGITEFVVGTGGRSLFPITGPDREDSEALS